MNNIKNTLSRTCRLVKDKPAVLIFIMIFMAAVVWLQRVEKVELYNRTGQTFEKGIVTEILQDNVQEDGQRIGEQTVNVRMTTGERKGQVIQMTSSAGYLFGTACTPGLHIVVVQSISGDSTLSAVYSRDRGNVLFLFAALYIVVLCLVGGKQGIRASAGLIFTFVTIIYIYIPLVYLGWSPIGVAILVCALTTLVTFYIIGGICKKTVVATCGTVLGVVIAALTAQIFSAASGITGWNVSNIESLLSIWETSEVQVGGLLFAGILISSLGAVMDVAMSISSSMMELAVQKPEISREELFKAGMRIGRDMMGTDSNTLILAFAGSEIAVLVLNYAYDLPLLQMINSNNIGIAIMQGLSGSFGIVLCVPVTVFLASVIYTERQISPMKTI